VYWSGKVAVVTGSSRGLGLAIARALVRRQAKVVITARDPARLEQAAAELRAGGGDVLAIPADITRQEDVDRLFRQVIAHWSRIDALVNNAGRSDRGDAMSTTADEFAQLINLNFISLVRCTRAALPQLIERQGHLVNIGSLAGKTGARYMGAYSASKFPVSGYSQQLRLELADRGLHVLLVSPGPIARDLAAPDEPRTYSAEKLSSIPPRAAKPGGGAKVRLLDPQVVAERILDACEKRKYELVLPGRARVLFAIGQLWPRLGDWLLRRMS
jgi:short-subunit dehydrogenase